jgi:hypothetical protein
MLEDLGLPKPGRRSRNRSRSSPFGRIRPSLGTLDYLCMVLIWVSFRRTFDESSFSSHPHGPLSNFFIYVRELPVKPSSF